MVFCPGVIPGFINVYVILLLHPFLCYIVNVEAISISGITK